MAVSKTFLPAKNSDILDYATQVDGVVTADAFDPTTVGLTADLVTALTAALAAANDANNAVTAAVAAKNAATQGFSGPSGAMLNLLGVLRNCANAARVSSVSDEALASIGISRRSGVPTPISAPTAAPEFAVASIVPGGINVRFRQADSASPRARDAKAIGVQIAYVNGANPIVDGEADTAPQVYASRTPALVNSSAMPDKVRLYARWLTQRGLTGPWSAAVSVAVSK